MAIILVVDDEPLNRELLHAYLEGSGHTLVDAESGERALEIARESSPDLVLLDVMMPGMNGFEAARRLKDLAGEQFLPIILITALADRVSRTEGLRAGADEFLTKPVDSVELGVRVTNLLALRANLAAVTSQRTSLAHRNAELTELHRFRDEMGALLVHDLKNPLSVIISNVDYLAEEMRTAPETSVQALHDVRAATRRMTRLLANLQDLARLEASRLELHRTVIGVAQLLEPIVHQRAVLARSRQLDLVLAVEARARAEADTDLAARVIENLLDNSFRHTPRGGRIEVAAHRDGDRVRIAVGNSGPPIPVGARDLIFEKFGQATAGGGRMNLGLGLYFCRLAIETHGGRLRLEERPHLPTVFALDLPAAKSSSNPPAAKSSSNPPPA